MLRYRPAGRHLYRAMTGSGRDLRNGECEECRGLANPLRPPFDITWERTMTRAPRTPAIILIVLAVASNPITAQDKNQLQKCAKPIGTLAVVEPQTEIMAALSRYKLESPTSLIRMMVQQSNCFLVVERGVAMQNMQQERALARSGEMQQDANMGGGQMKAADFILTPRVLFSEGNAGGIGGGVAGVLGRRNPVLGAVGGGLKFKEAQTTILIADARTTVQVAAAEGKAKKTDFGLGMLGFTGGALVGAGGYTNTNEGKVVAASFLDNYNNIVTGVLADPAMQKRAESFSASGLSGGEVKAGATYAEGDVLTPKIDNVKLLAEPGDAARAAATLKKGDELVFLGDEKEGFLRVQGSAAEGWVKKTLVSKR
jgi:hypothetical protein